MVYITELGLEIPSHNYGKKIRYYKQILFYLINEQ